MSYDYDTWGRTKCIGYPDGERVYYNYNRAGDLYSMTGQKGNEYFRYINAIEYNKFGQKTAIQYGNGTRAEYQYDNLQRLSHLNSYTARNEQMQSIGYSYDPASNITGIANAAGQLSNGLGGSYINLYEYDDLYRLTSACGGSGQQAYRLDMKYSSNGKILQKKFTDYSMYNGNTYSNTSQNDYFYRHGANRLESVNYNGNYTQSFRWDDNGSMTSRDGRHHCWDEENRLKAIENYGDAGYYIYDASGERSCKMTVAIGRGNYNGHGYAYSNITSYTLYTSPYLVATTNHYTKHYYAGNDRICSKIGGGGLSDLFSPPRELDTEGKRTGWREPYESLWQSCANVILPPCSLYFYPLYDGQTVQQPETDIYYYLPDHLGSSSWITDAGGYATQHLRYLPFGETVHDQRNTSWCTRYSFSAKEKDEESGYSYFGARYYDSELSIWLSVDPMAHKYPGLTPYNYCMNSPVMYQDPNGEFVWIIPVIIGAVMGACQGYQMATANGATGWAMAGYIFGGGAIGAVSGLAGGAIAGVIGQSLTISGAGIIGAGVGGAVSGAISGFGFTTMATGSVSQGMSAMWKGAVAGLAGGAVGSAIGGGTGAFLGGATAGAAGTALNGGSGKDMLISALVGGAVSLGSYHIQQGISYGLYKQAGGEWNYRQFYKISVATQRSFAWGREAGGWILDHGRMGQIAYGGKDNLTMPSRPDNATEWFHTHPNLGKNWLEMHSDVDINLNNNVVKLSSFVIGRQNVYFQRPMGNSMFLYKNTYFNPYPYSNFWFGYLNKQ